MLAWSILRIYYSSIILPGSPHNKATGLVAGTRVLSAAIRRRYKSVSDM